MQAQLAWCKPFVFSVVMLGSTLSSFAQDENLLDLVAQEMKTDIHGTPLSNGVDPDRSRFGPWHYLDVEGQRFYSREYEKGIVKKEFIWYQGKYVAAHTANAGELTGPEEAIARSLRKNNVQTGPDKACLFVLDTRTRSVLLVIPYGNWSSEERKKIQNLITPQPINSSAHVTLIWK